MERSWWWKTALFLAVIVLAGVSLVPSFVPEEKQPALLKKVFKKKIQEGLDLAGGLRLVYAVDVDRAVQAKVDQIANSVEDTLKKTVPDVTVTREGRDDVVFTFKNPADAAKLTNDVLADNRDSLERVSDSNGVVRYRLDNDEVAEIQDFALRQGIETIRGRVDKFGVAEPTIIKKGTDIVIELPGLEQRDFERIKNIVGKTAQLEFKIVDDGAEYMKKVAATVPKDGAITVDYDQWSEDKTGVRHEDIFLRAKKREDLEAFVAGLKGDLAVPSDREFGFEETANRGEGDAAPDRFWRTYLLKKRSAVTGDYLADAQVGFDEMNKPEVLFTMNRKGGDLMGKLTGENVGRKMAIVLDDKIQSAPVVQSQINDRGRITLGVFGDPLQIQTEAKDLVAVLRSGALPAPLKKTFETQVGRTLGDDAVQKAKFAMTIGGIGVILFMLIYYKAAGLIANIAMGLNLLFLLAILAAFEAALTLPGIAGLGLTIGMAVDANIIIYERIREELRLGKSPRSAVDAGFNRAFWTVFDAHITNLVAGIVLYSYGSGPIRGFAVTLIFGVLANLLTSVWMSRWLFDLMVGRRGSSPATLSI